MSEKSSGLSAINVLVLGWYNKGNLGDDLFVQAFQYLFPAFNFTFTDHIKASHLKDVDVVFIGGGSFLSSPPEIDSDALPILQTKKLFYIGVGTETQIHPGHASLMQLAKLIATRTDVHVNDVLQINANTIVIPDLIYCLTPSSAKKVDKSILFIPNITVVPTWKEPHWKHVSWAYFKSELAQTLDELIREDFSVRFLPLCTNYQLDDRFAATEIINSMSHRDYRMVLDKEESVKDVTKLISQFEIVVTQRYHGIVLSNLAQTPNLSIYHHDKLKNEHSLSYYETSKNKLLEKITERQSNYAILPIDLNIFDSLKKTVIDLIL